MKIADFRLQSSTPSTPGSSVVGCYANASGNLVLLDSAGATKEVGAKFSPDSLVSGLAQAAVTGRATFVENGGTGAALTGFVGLSGTYMGFPNAFLKVTASGGSDFLIPLYKSI